MSRQHVCVVRDEIDNAEREVNRELPADDVISFDVAARIILLKELVDQLIVSLPQLVLQPVLLHDKFLNWMKARVELDHAERELHGRSAFDELIASKRQLERYIGFLRNQAHNSVDVAHEVRDNPRLGAIVRELRADVFQFPENYAKGGGAIPAIVLSTFEYSRFLKTIL